MAAPVPIYVIALEHTHARRKAISERLGALGLSFTFISAAIGKKSGGR
ncbi:MAG: glycosyltransferase family 25 protein [Candidatus Puniceispirillaceae bacterium]